MIPYPSEAVEGVRDRLMDLDWNLPGDEAEEVARNIVIDVTLAVYRMQADPDA